MHTLFLTPAATPRGEIARTDTEGSFMVERVAEMADAVAAHLQRLAARDAAAGRPASVRPSPWAPICGARPRQPGIRCILRFSAP